MNMCIVLFQYLCRVNNPVLHLLFSIQEIVLAPVLRDTSLTQQPGHAVSVTRVRLVVEF